MTEPAPRRTDTPLRSRLERCDQDGIAAYLESSNPQNVPLYEHFGLQVTGTLDLPNGVPAVTTMWRPARGSEQTGTAPPR